MAKKRSVGVEETENKARAEIRRFWLMFPPGGFYGDMPTGLGPVPVAQLKRLPAPWRDYLLFTLQGPSSQNAVRRSGKHGERNSKIRLCVEGALDAGLKATRSRHQRYIGGAHSACSLVADELKALGLHLSEDAVEKIWRQTAPTLIGSVGKK